MKELCKLINMPEAVTAEVLQLHDDPGFQPDIAGLCREACWADVLKQLSDALGEDARGMKLLCCMLRCALNAKETYRKLGISDAIYADTFACFSRFVREHQESYGCYGFDRGFWTVRQVSCRLFRIGELEYELTALEGKPAISLHIPTDIRLEPALLRQSWAEARELLWRIFPDCENAPVFCRSWLLSPDLKGLLPAGSRILAFQEAFTITPQPSHGGYVQWVFKNPRLSPADYPEDTSLQRSLKAWLLAGHSFRDGMGYLKEEPFGESHHQTSAGC